MALKLFIQVCCLGLLMPLIGLSPMVAQQTVPLQRLEDILHSNKPDTAKIRELDKLGVLLQARSQFTVARKTALAALELASKMPGACCQWSLNQQLLDYYRFTGQLDSADIYHKYAISQAMEKGDPDKTMYTHEILGHTFFDYNQPSKAIHYYKEALEVARQEDDSLQQLYYSKQIASTYQTMGERDSAEKVMTEAKEFFAGSVSHHKGFYCETLGNYHYYAKDYYEMLKNYLTALEAYKNEKNANGIAKVLVALGDFYSDLGNHHQALQYYLDLLEKVKSEPNSNLANLYNSIGWAYKNMGENDTAMRYFQKSLEIYQTHDPGNLWRAYPIGNIGLIYEARGLPDSAIYYSQEAFNLFVDLRYIEGQAEALNNVGFALLQQSDFESSRAHFMAGLKLGQQSSELYEQINSYKGLYRLEKQAGSNSKALEYLEKYIQLQDSIIDVHSITRIQQLEAELEQDRGRATIHELERKSILNQEQIKRQRIINIGAVAITTLALLALFLILHYWRSKNKTLNELKKINAELSVMNSTNRKIISIISHDFRAPLTSIHSLLGLLRQKEITQDEFIGLTDLLYRQTEEVTLMIDTFLKWAISKSRDIKLHVKEIDLRPVFEETIHSLKPSADQKTIQLNIKECITEKPMADQMSATLVLRNLISNAIKFSHAGSQINIGSYLADCYAVVYVEDSGVGMGPEKLNQLFSGNYESSHGTQNEKGTGFGLMMSKEFVELNGGKIWATSEKGKGTTFYFSLPLKTG